MKLIVKQVYGKGRGVFAGQNIARGELVEICPVVVLPVSDVRGKLDDYVFCWDENKRLYAIGLGFASLYNHSRKPNIEIELHPERQEIWFRAIKPVDAGSELVHDYDYEPIGYVED
jgi:uncharacterized protein